MIQNLKSKQEGGAHYELDIPSEYKLIGMKTITEMTGFTSAYIYKCIAEGKFPAALKF